MIHFDDISDDEIRIIGNSSEPPRRRRWIWAAIAVLAVILAIVAASLLTTQKVNREMAATSVITAVEEESEPTHPYIVECEPATVLIRDTVINDVPLRLHTPVNALPELMVGTPDPSDESLILALQAADIRADNHGIVGAFVLKGELLARGIAKKGFCAIINESIQLGMAESTPLFEEAINKEGYFFRQYPLVVNGKMVENKPKGKALRHALCELDGKVVVVSSRDKESFHDFAQTLEDLGVQNAIYLVGSDAYGFCRVHTESTSEAAAPEVWGKISEGKAFENVNYVVWRVPGKVTTTKQQ